MSKVVKLAILIVVVALAARGYEYVLEWRTAEEKSPNHKTDAVDLMIGRAHVERYLDIKEKSPEFNIPALKTAFSQFYLEQGRYPQSLAELERSNLVGPEATHDPFGQAYHLQYQAGQVVLTSPGKDKLAGTEDDTRLTFPLQ